MFRPVLRKISVGLSGVVPAPVEEQHPGLDVEAAAVNMRGQHARLRNRSLAVEPERMLDGRDALFHAQEPANIAAAQDCYTACDCIRGVHFAS